MSEPIEFDLGRRLGGEDKPPRPCTPDVLQKSAEAYLEDYRIHDLLSFLLRQTIVDLPADPLQFLIDLLTFDDPELARQDERGLSGYRRQQLTKLFNQMDKDGSGSVEFKEIYQHSTKYGGLALSREELQAVFEDFDTSGDSTVSVLEFLTFFARTLVHCSNEDFEGMLKEMLD